VCPLSDRGRVPRGEERLGSPDERVARMRRDVDETAALDDSASAEVGLAPSLAWGHPGRRGRRPGRRRGALGGGGEGATPTPPRQRPLW